MLPTSNTQEPGSGKYLHISGFFQESVFLERADLNYVAADYSLFYITSLITSGIFSTVLILFQGVHSPVGCCYINFHTWFVGVSLVCIREHIHIKQSS